LVSPYYKNFNKRVIKSPKIYFYDSALVCALLGIKTVDELAMHPMRGALFESFVISEIFKYYYNRSETPQVFFWRDVQGHEIDCVIERSLDHVIPIEIKAGMTVKNEFFKGFLDWENITKKTNTHYVVYGGNENIQRKQAHIFSWRNIDEMMHVLISNHRP
jgi:predicted AAA+ superfamily ATPase